MTKLSGGRTYDAFSVNRGVKPLTKKQIEIRNMSIKASERKRVQTRREIEDREEQMAIEKEFAL